MVKNVDSLLGAALYSPELADHPLTILPVLDIGDSNPMTVKENRPNDALTELGTIKVGITEWKATDAYDVLWEPVVGAKSYRLWASMSPVLKDKDGDFRPVLMQDNIVSTQARFLPPYFSEVVAYFLWVSYLDQFGNETFITDVAASLMATNDKRAFNPNPFTDDPKFYPSVNELNRELAFDLEYIRKNTRMGMEIGAEPAYLYLRRHTSDRPWGQPCSCVRRMSDDDSDPDQEGNGVDRCMLCFGTGVFGGFLPKIKIAIIKDGATSGQSFSWGKKGMMLNHVFNTQMLWTPTVRVGDLIVRASDGSRFTVTLTNPDVAIRAVRLMQFFDLDQIAKTDIKMQLTDSAIARSIKMAKLPGFLKDGYRLFS